MPTHTFQMCSRNMPKANFFSVKEFIFSMSYKQEIHLYKKGKYILRCVIGLAFGWKQANRKLYYSLIAFYLSLQVEFPLQLFANVALFIYFYCYFVV